MGNQHSRPEDRLRHISREANSLRSSLRTSQRNISKDKKEFLVANLAHYSSEVSSMNGKVKRKQVEDTLRNLSETMEEVLKIEPTELDGAAVESNSFVNIPLNKNKSSSMGSLRNTRKTPTKEILQSNRSSVPTLRDIESKVSEMKGQIGTAIDNRDTQQLRVYQQTLKVLAAEIEMIHVERDTPVEKRKESIDKKILSLYQKVSRTLKELKRDTSSQSQSTQQKKEKAMTELLEIETNLAQNESLLDKLMKEKISSEFITVRNNIMANNQKLSKIDIIDNEVKDKVIFLSQKISETVKNLDRVMAKREFDSKFNNSLNTYERIIKNFDANSNVEDTMNKLQSLRNSIQNLEEINDTSKNRKKELLQRINDNINEISDVVEKSLDQKIVEQIVEDNVILRKKVKSTDKEHTVIDQFINHWNNVKSNFNINAYSNLSLLRIDSVLEEMQQSINDIRIGIANKCDINPPNNLNRKHSNSVPRLNTRKSYGSNKSLDRHEDNKIIKTKAKIYNVSTPELQNVAKQQQIYANNRFSKIEEIKLQVHYIKEKIDATNNKKLLRDKLEQYLKSLEEYTNDPNKTIQNNASIVSNEIIELLYRIILNEMREQVNVLSKKVHNFNGIKYNREYEEIKDDLIKVQLNLENFNIPDHFDSLTQEKGEILDEIQNSIESLQEKGSHYRKHEDGKVKQIKTKLQELTEKVRRFSGTYKGVLYNTIERDLNKLLLDVEDQVEDKVCSNEIAKETERLLKILEQRSSLAQSFKSSKPDQVKSEEQAGMQKIKSDLFNIKREIDRTSENDIDAFIGLQSRLDLVYFELSQISARSNENLAKEKEIFGNEAQTLKNVVDAKVALGQQPMVQWPERELQPKLKSYSKNDVNKEMEQFESAFLNIKKEISAPNSEQDVHKSYKLAQDIKKLIDKLNKYKFIKGTDLQMRQRSLLNEMQDHVDILEQGAIDIDYVLSIERKVDKLEDLFDNGQQDLKVMAKELHAIQKKLQDPRFKTTNINLTSRKISIQQKTEDLVQKLKEIEDGEKHESSENIRKIDEIEQKIGALAPKVTSFIGTKKDNEYYELNETIIRTVLLLDNMSNGNPEMQKRRMKLLKDLHALGEILDERTKQTQEVVSIEESINAVSLLIDNFTGGKEELKVISDKMEAIKKPLNSLKVINDLIPRKNACIERYSSLFNKTMTLEPVKSNHESSFVYSTYTVSNVNSGTKTQVYNFTSGTPTTSHQDDEKVDLLSRIDKEVDGMERIIQTANDFNQLQKLDDTLTQYTIKIGNLKYTKDSPEYPRVYRLYQKIENLTDIIEEKLQDHDRINSISEEIDAISTRMDSPLTREQIDQLDEQLIQLQISLNKMVNPELKTQIDGCMMKIIFCMQKISEYRGSVQARS